MTLKNITINDLATSEYVIQSEFDAMKMFIVRFCASNSPFYDGNKWAVRCTGYCLSKNCEWEYEPSPSSRDDAFYQCFRFDSLQDAVDAYNKAGGWK